MITRFMTWHQIYWQDYSKINQMPLYLIKERGGHRATLVLKKPREF